MCVLLWLLLVVAAIVDSTARVGLHPFLALILGAIAMGLLAGLDGLAVIDAVGAGFGGTLQAIGLVIAAGAVIGEYLHRSGGARVMANAIPARGANATPPSR